MSRISLLILLIFCALPGHAQQLSNSLPGGKGGTFSAIEDSHNQVLDSIYTVRTGTEIAYINGHDYYPYHYRAKNKPLLFAGKDRKASINVSGRQYDNIILQYDTYTDEIIFSEMDNDFGDKVYQVSINKDIVSSFTFYFRDDTLNFKSFSEEDAGSGMPSGFYEVAYDGNSRYLVRHRSVVHERNGIDEYFYRPAGYVMTENGYHKITSDSRFIKLFGTGSAEMKSILDQRDLNMRKAGKRQIINVLKSYDSLQGVPGMR